MRTATTFARALGDEAIFRDPQRRLTRQIWQKRVDAYCERVIAAIASVGTDRVVVVGQSEEALRSDGGAQRDTVGGMRSAGRDQCDSGCVGVRYAAGAWQDAARSLSLAR